METDENFLDLNPDKLEIKKNENIFTDRQDITTPQQSPNFVYGVSGWRLGSNGIIDAVGVRIAGTVDPIGALWSVAEGGTGATTLTGILKGNGTSAFTTITPLAGTKIYYVADSSGGAVNRKLTFVDGVLTAET